MKSHNIFKKILNDTELDAAIVSLKKSGKTIAFTNGCFDIIHLGHISLLQECSSYADILIVGLNSDNSVKRLKGSERPLNNQEARAKTLAAVQFIDYITLFDADTPIDLITRIKPDVLVKGGDWKPEQIIGADFVQSYGGSVKVVPFIEGYSTSILFDKLKQL